MQIKFLRNTRDENGNYRGDDYFKNAKGEVFCQNDGSINYTGVHAFDSGVAITFDQYYEELLKEAIGGAYHPNPPFITPQNALRDLAVMLDYKLVIPVLEGEATKLQEWADKKAK